MADHAEDDNDGDIFVYRGGRAPQHVTHVIIDESVDEIEAEAFKDCIYLVKVETHDGIRRVGRDAFNKCTMLPRINLKLVSEINDGAFYKCVKLADVEFGDELETIGEGAFAFCKSLEHLKLPSIVTIGTYAFVLCSALIDIEFSERLETVEKNAFNGCKRLRRIAIPMKRDLFQFDDELVQFTQFHECEQLTTVALVGGIQKTVASLHMESWRNDMIANINQMNQVLPTTHVNEKTDLIRQWMESVHDKMVHYKAEHCRYIKEGITLIELALWKAKLGEKEESAAGGESKKANVDDAEIARKGKRITCGADTVVKNVLPFLKME